MLELTDSSLKWAQKRQEQGFAEVLSKRQGVLG
jgi:hypothetical protein